MAAKRTRSKTGKSPPQGSLFRVVDPPLCFHCDDDLIPPVVRKTGKHAHFIHTKERPDFLLDRSHGELGTAHDNDIRNPAENANATVGPPDGHVAGMTNPSRNTRRVVSSSSR